MLFNKSAFPWCSTEMDLLQIKQNKLYKVFCECVFLVIPAIFFFEPIFQNLNTSAPFLFLCRSSHGCILTTFSVSLNSKCKNLFSHNDSISDSILPFVKE